MTTNLSVSRLVRVNVILAALAAQSQNLNAAIVLTSSPVVDVTERQRAYTSSTQVSTDFGSSGPEYASAVLYFQQTPQPAKLYVGRWAKTDTAGVMRCGPVSSTNSAIAAWNAVTTGSLKFGADATAAADITGMNFTTDANLNAVAARIQAAVRAAAGGSVYAGVTVVYNAGYNRFEFTSGTTGAASNVLFLQAAAAGTDISAMLSGTALLGAYRADGIVAETALAAATLFDSQFGRSWYGLNIPEGVAADHVAVAGFIESTLTKHVYALTTQDANALSAVATSDVAYQLAQLKYTKTMVQYSSTSAYASMSLLAKSITTDWGGNNTTITLMYKQEPGIVAESINETQALALAAKNCNVFVNYDNSTAIIQNGVVCSGDFIDTIVAADAFAIDVQTQMYNLLYTSPTKLPQTDGGANVSVTAVSQICDRYLTNGFLGGGVWDQAGFGNLKQGDFLEKGYYVYAPPVASQLKPDRASRKSVPIQVAAKCAGAVHSFDITLNISR